MSMKNDGGPLKNVNFKSKPRENYAKQYESINGHITSVTKDCGQQLPILSEIKQEKVNQNEASDECLGSKQIKSVVVNFTSGTMAKSSIQNQYVSNTSPHVQTWNGSNDQNKIKTILISSVLLMIGLAVGYIFSGLVTCKGQDVPSTTGATLQNTCLTEECVRTASSLLAAMDRTVDPCKDFFQFACGTWNKKHVIPEDRSSISTFEVLADQQQVILKGVLEESVDVNDNQATLKAKMFYKSCMDLQQIRKIGIKPIRNVLKSLGGWPVIEPNWTRPNASIEQLIGTLRGVYSEPVLVELYVGADDKNSSRNILQKTS